MCIRDRLYAFNLLGAILRKSNLAYKQHLTAGFYFGATFCMLLAMFTGASQSPYSVSYTHLDVYKRQVVLGYRFIHVPCAGFEEIQVSDFKVGFVLGFGEINAGKNIYFLFSIIYQAVG